MSEREMNEKETINTEMQFSERHKMLSNRDEFINMAKDIRGMLSAHQLDALRKYLHQFYPPDIADLMYFLNDNEFTEVFQQLVIEEQAEVLDEVDDPTKTKITQGMEPGKLAKILENLHSDEDADILEVMESNYASQVLSRLEKVKADHIRMLMAYPKESAGGIMSTGYISVLETDTFSQALDRFRQRTDAEPLFNMFVVDGQAKLLGKISLRELLDNDPGSLVKDHLEPNVVSVPPEMDREQVARIFARYDLSSLPVVTPLPEGKLLGLITPDDIIDVIQAENTEDFMRMTGSDAEEMEKRSPVRLALMRLPWIMATMFIELMAGFAIRVFNPTLSRVLLLASFMPIISAISGNTGLQSATIIVRGLSAGKIEVAGWHRAVLRQLTMTLILGSVTGITLGTIGAIWYGKLMFGIVVAVGMFSAVNIAGIVGTVVPLTSKKLGFDPAITSGPFETAFQDVVGISIFLGLATLLIHYLL